MEWGSLTVAEIVKMAGGLAIPFALGKWLWKKAVTEEIQKVGVKADAAAKAAKEAKDSVEEVPKLLTQFSQRVADDLSKMSIHYSDSVKATAEATRINLAAKIEMEKLKHTADIELTKFKIFGGKFAVRLGKVEEEVAKLKVGKVVVIGDDKRKK